MSAGLIRYSQSSSSSAASMEASNSTQPQEKTKLSTSEVFEKIRPLMCSVNSSIGEASGFFLDKETIITVKHNIPRDGSVTDLVQINYDKELPYFPDAIPELVKKHTEILDLYCLKAKVQAPQPIPVIPDSFQLREGMKVCFAGYPLGQDSITFHKGYISSVIQEDGITRFTIDGTVVPGNSGGPVVIQYEGNVYLIGVITSEIADFSPEDQKTIAIMKALKEQAILSSQAPFTGFRIGNTSISASGATTRVQINTPQGPEVVEVHDRATIHLALDLFQRNLSTGIGKAIDIRHYRQLFQMTPALRETRYYSFPVAKGKKLIMNTIANTVTKEILFKYIEVRYGKGAGNRGIRIQFASQPTTLTYKFSPNPHSAPGNYNKNQEDLYGKAALFVGNTWLEQSKILESFKFEACQSTYTAVLEN